MFFIHGNSFNRKFLHLDAGWRRVEIQKWSPPLKFRNELHFILDDYHSGGVKFLYVSLVIRSNGTILSNLAEASLARNRLAISMDFMAIVSTFWPIEL